MNKKTALLIFFIFLLFSCSGTRTAKQSEVVAGNDRDSHGCIGSAGYEWCEVLNDCIRIFEKGVRTESDKNDVCYIVFSVDSLKAELFFSNGLQSEILDRRTLSNGGYVWNVEDDDTKNIRKIDGEWIIEQRGEEIYHQVK